MLSYLLIGLWLCWSKKSKYCQHSANILKNKISGNGQNATHWQNFCFNCLMIICLFLTKKICCPYSISVLYTKSQKHRYCLNILCLMQSLLLIWECSVCSHLWTHKSVKLFYYFTLAFVICLFIKDW